MQTNSGKQQGISVGGLAIIAMAIAMVSPFLIQQYRAFQALGYNEMAEAYLNGLVKRQNEFHATKNAYSLGENEIKAQEQIRLIILYSREEDRWLALAKHRDGNREFCYDSQAGKVIEEETVEGSYDFSDCNGSFSSNLDDIRFRQETWAR